eukprot:TRINITY_DN534_c0_g1_i6.p1 TRINITY_DN534_c0_g1~~TRINITY_DN534_c0_g1_i6.p1  ORF type:complete len:392 (-),score=47.14 TRINITY_DN534_c0_g1_i6:26-1126(-)
MQVSTGAFTLARNNELWGSYCSEFSSLVRKGQRSWFEVYKRAILKTLFVRISFTTWPVLLLTRKSVRENGEETVEKEIACCTGHISIGHGIFPEHPPIKPKEGYNSVCLNKFEVDSSRHCVPLVKEIMKLFLTCFWERHLYYHDEYLQESDTHDVEVPFRVVQEGNYIWVFYYYNAVQRNPRYLRDLLSDMPFSYLSDVSEAKMLSKPYDSPIELFHDTILNFPRKEEKQHHVSGLFHWLADRIKEKDAGISGNGVTTHSQPVSIDSFFCGIANMLPIPLGGMKCQGKLEETFPRKAWNDNVEFLANMKWLQVIVKPAKGEEGAILWDVPEPCQQWVGPKGKWCQQCARYDDQVQDFIEKQKEKRL